MKKSTCFLFTFLGMVFLSCNTQTQIASPGEDSFTNSEKAIKNSMQAWADAFKYKEYEKALNLFDTSSHDIMLIGSDSSEILTGKEQIGPFLQTFFNQPFGVSWEYKSIDINHHQNTAWAFVNANLVISEGEKVTHLPYRFVVVLVVINNEWKWKLYHGSEPKPV